MKNKLYEITQLTKIYPGVRPVTALFEISLDIYEGEFLLITGPSGCGKSTLLNLIGTLDIPTSGAILYRGEPLTSASEARLADYRRNEIGVVFQLFRLIPGLTVLENVVLPTLPFRKELREAPEIRGEELLRLVGLDARADHYPSQLSGGEAQRVAIARALIQSPSVVLADEPTGNLDSEASKEIIRLLKKINTEEGKTIVLVSHDLRNEAVADRKIELVDGRISAG